MEDRFTLFVCGSLIAIGCVFMGYAYLSGAGDVGEDTNDVNIERAK
jgi:hypothetical protein